MESCCQLWYFQGPVRTSKASFISQVSLSQLPSNMYLCLQDHRIAETGGSSGDHLVHPPCSWQAPLQHVENSPVGFWIISEDGDSTASLATSSYVQTPLQQKSLRVCLCPLYSSHQLFIHISWPHPTPKTFLSFISSPCLFPCSGQPSRFQF